MIILDRIKRATTADVPYLKVLVSTIRAHPGQKLTRMDLSRLPLTIWISSNWRQVTGPVWPTSVRCAFPVRTMTVNGVKLPM